MSFFSICNDRVDFSELNVTLSYQEFYPDLSTCNILSSQCCTNDSIFPLKLNQFFSHVQNLHIKPSSDPSSSHDWRLLCITPPNINLRPPSVSFLSCIRCSSWSSSIVNFLWVVAFPQYNSLLSECLIQLILELNVRSVSN